jgi:hypothetical protein
MMFLTLVQPKVWTGGLSLQLRAVGKKRAFYTLRVSTAANDSGERCTIGF